MKRVLIISVLIIIAAFLLLDVYNRNVEAQGAGNLNLVLENQKLILEKLEAMDNKLDIIRVRVRL